MAKIAIVNNNVYYLKAIFLTFLSMTTREKEEAEYLKKLGKRIKSIRKEKGIKQVDLGYSCDIEKQSMNRIEAGNTNPSILLLRKIAELLGMSLGELLDF